MSKGTLYNYNPNTPEAITREPYFNAGSGDNILGDVRRAYDATTFKIWDSLVAGTQLIIGVDYEIRDKDIRLSSDAGYFVYSAYRIINATYQDVQLWFDYDIVMSYNDADISSTVIGNTDLNDIINPEFGIWQEGVSITAATTPANSDDTYVSDQWILLSDGNDVVDVSRSTDAPAGSKYSMKFLVATANKKFGILQIIEGENVYKYVDEKGSMSFGSKTTSGKVIENLRASILSWDSTEDTVTSDVVSAWAVEGTNPTLVANWTAENTAVNIPITTDWVNYKVEGVDIDTSGMKNLAIFIWVDDTDAALNDELFISQVQLQKGSKVMPYSRRKKANEVTSSQRFFEKSYDLDVAPGTVTLVGKKSLFLSGMNSSDSTVRLQIDHKVTKRITPTISTWSDTGSAGDVSTITSDTRTPTVGGAGVSGFYVQASNGSANTGREISLQYIADARL